MTELENLVFYQKYRPQTFDELIFQGKELILSYLSKPLEMPSFIFHSNKPGTGKTTCAKLIAKALDCDMLELNASKDSGIDVMRERIDTYIQSLSTNPNAKRMIFLDEADGMTPKAIDSMRNIMESYSKNGFFVLTCNNLSKISEAVRSRCVVVNFEKPDKNLILNRLEYICQKESMDADPEDLAKLIDLYHPDIRSMIQAIQRFKMSGEKVCVDGLNFEEYLKHMQTKNLSKMRDIVYAGELDHEAFIQWFFRWLMSNHERLGFERVSKMSRYVADVERSKNMGSNSEIIFLADMIQVSQLF